MNMQSWGFSLLAVLFITSESPAATCESLPSAEWPRH